MADGWQQISTAREFETVLTQHKDDLFPVAAFRVGNMWLREVEGPEDECDRPGALQPLYQPPTHWMLLPDPPSMKDEGHG